MMQKEQLTFDQVPSLLSYLINAVDELTHKVDNLARTSGELSDKVTKPGSFVAGRKILNIDQAAMLIGKARSTMYRYAEQNILPCSKRNGCIYFFEDDLIKWIEGGKPSVRH